MSLPYLHRPHDSGPIQWACGGVGIKPCAAARPLHNLRFGPLGMHDPARTDEISNPLSAPYKEERILGLDG